MNKLPRTLATIVIALSSARYAPSAGAQTLTPDLDAIVRKIVDREQVGQGIGPRRP